MLKLQFKDRRREAVWLVDKVFTIGHNARNSLMVDNVGIAEFHAELINEHDKLTLVNKSGGLSLWVNGMPISDHTVVKAGDTITLGELELELVDPKAGPSAPKTETKGRSDWSISSKASWLDKGRYAIEDKVIIGRDPSCDIVLPLDHLSRQHVTLEIRRGQLFVKDLDSANGTFLNGERVKEAPLKAGDKLKLDVVTFEVGGPTHDPHKTIIRSVSSPKKTEVREEQHAARPATPAMPRTKAKAAKKAKRLVADGKQDWIQGQQTRPEPSKSSSGGVFILVGLALLIAAVWVISQQL